MVMSEPLLESVKRRPEEEAARTGYPAGFPVLPGVPAGRYADEAFAALEADGVFGRSWLFVAHADELREEGDYRVVDQLPQPIVLVRDGQGIRAFYNTCKHRGSALVLDPTGNTGRRLTCPYHNWVYGLDGALLGYPAPADFGELDRDCHALTAVRCETWGPLVFINLDPDAEPLGDFLADVGDDLTVMAELDGVLRLAAHTSVDVAANWKLPVDANIETYHVNYVHRDSAALALEQPRTGIQLLANGHSRMLIRLRDELDLDLGMGMPAVFDGVGDLPLLGTFSYHVFPNLSIVFGGTGFLFLITNWPAGPTTSTYHVHWCSSLDPDEHRDTLAELVAFNRSVLLEDLSVIPSIQRSIDVGALHAVRLSYQERRIHHVHEAIDRAIGAERIPEELRVPQLLGAFVER